jgi:hypothetical protein
MYGMRSPPYVPDIRMSRPRICTWIVWRLATEASAKSISPRVESILVYKMCTLFFCPSPSLAVVGLLGDEGRRRKLAQKKEKKNPFLYHQTKINRKSLRDVFNDVSKYIRFISSSLNAVFP